MNYLLLEFEIAKRDIEREEISKGFNLKALRQSRADKKALKRYTVLGRAPRSTGDVRAGLYGQRMQSATGRPVTAGPQGPRPALGPGERLRSNAQGRNVIVGGAGPQGPRGSVPW